MKIYALLVLSMAAFVLLSGCSSKTEISSGGGKPPETAVQEQPDVQIPETDSLATELSELESLDKDIGNLNYLEEDLNTISNI